MTWTITARGSVADVRKHVEDATCYGNPSQFDVARQFILSKLDTWRPPSPTAARHAAMSRRVGTTTLRPADHSTPVRGRMNNMICERSTTSRAPCAR